MFLEKFPYRVKFYTKEALALRHAALMTQGDFRSAGSFLCKELGEALWIGPKI